MKRLTLMLAGALSLPTATAAQAAPDLIERALAAAPDRVRDGAAVIRWNADYTYETLKEGTNRMVCYDRSAEARRSAFAVQCTSVGNLERVAQNRRFRAESASADEERALIGAAEADGTRVAPEYGSLWISMNGNDQAGARTHTTIAVPFATTASTGLPENGREGGAWIMDAGTSTAHIMTPGH
jgi:hypothetical protein